MKTQKGISLENLEWERLATESRMHNMSLGSRIEQLINLGRVKERELKQRDENIRKKEMLEIGKQS